MTIKIVITEEVLMYARYGQVGFRRKKRKTYTATYNELLRSITIQTYKFSVLAPPFSHDCISLYWFCHVYCSAASIKKCKEFRKKGIYKSPQIVPSPPAVDQYVSCTDMCSNSKDETVINTFYCIYQPKLIYYPKGI